MRFEDRCSIARNTSWPFWLSLFPHYLGLAVLAGNHVRRLLRAGSPVIFPRAIADTVNVYIYTSRYARCLFARLEHC